MRGWAHRSAQVLISLGLISAGACSRSNDAKPADTDLAHANPPKVRDRSEALALIEQFECARCHDGSGATPVPTDKHCVRCHQEIQDGSYPSDPKLLAKWSANIHSLQVTPALDSLAAKLRRDWVQKQLRAPRDVRPALEASMPRLPLSEQQAAILAEDLVPTEKPEQQFPTLSVARGAELYDRLNCNACHAFGDRKAVPRTIVAGTASHDASRSALLLAPDLLLTRERFQSGALVPWLMNPQSLQPGTLMPNFNLKESEATSLAAFIWYGAGEPVAMPELGERLPVLEREVGWDEVFSSVIKTVCWHCHSSKEFALGDGGPGNTGGFGYAARGLDMSSYEAILSGSIGPDGRRRSVFSKDENGVPLIIGRMLAREQEERGHQGAAPGMPLGFPAMTREQIQLVESWLAQGRPR